MTARVLLCAKCGSPQVFDELDLSMFCPICAAKEISDA